MSLQLDAKSVDGRDKPAMTTSEDGRQIRKACKLDASSHIAIDETSARLRRLADRRGLLRGRNLRWAFGFYGQSVYLAELHSAARMAGVADIGRTTFFYLFGAAIVVFVLRRSESWPAQLPVGRVCAMAASVVLIGRVEEPWQLYAADALLAFGWAGTTLGIITIRLGCGSTRSAGWRSAWR